MRVLFLLLLAGVPAFPQFLGGGVKGGVPLTDFFDATTSGNFGYFSKPNRYIVGVFGEVRLPFGLGVEVDALYRRLNYSGTLQNGTVATTANAWEFPLLLKYRFPVPVARPFISGGVAWDRLSGLTETIRTQSIVNTSKDPAALDKKTTTGFVLGAGLDVKFLFLHVSPEVRYTRWGARHFFDPNGLLGSNRNQAEFLVGLSF